MNPTFHWAKGIGYGVLIWLIMFAFVSLLVGFEVQSTLWGQALSVGVAGLLAYALSLDADPRIASYAFAYGALWVAIGVLLDLVVTYQFNNAIFSSWQYWAGYALVLIAPWVQRTLRTDSTHRHSMA